MRTNSSVHEPSQLCAKAYELDPPDVLRMARAIGTAANISGARSHSASGKSELVRAADHLIQSLTGRLQSADLELLSEIVDTMADVGVGNQVFLDMVMALVMARHHQDCRALSPRVALGLASALGRVATCSIRLRPRGVGGPGASTNARVMEILQQRISAQLCETTEGDLAGLNDYYITRLCDDAPRRAILIRMSELNLGFRESTKQFLPLMVKMQQSVQRELPEAFRWSLPRPTRVYLDELKHQGLRDHAAVTDNKVLACMSTDRRKLHDMRVAEALSAH